MRWYRASDGAMRIWFEPGEIEAIAEDELRRAGLLPASDRPVVNIETFVEQYLRVELDQHAPLPPEILGLTEFIPGRPPRILVNADLTSSAVDPGDPPQGRRGRWRATLAHEAAHVLLHRALAEPDPNQLTLFGPFSPQPVFRCLKREVAFGGGSDWREAQANRAMAALLMPRSLFLGAARQLRRQRATSAAMPIRESCVEPAATELAVLFDVSRQAASIRLAELGLVAAERQEHLLHDPEC